MRHLTKEIEKSFSKLEKLIPKEKLSEFSRDKANNMEWYNEDGMGALIRLKLLRKESVLRKAFLQSGYADSDEMALLIIKEFHKHLKR